MNNQQINWQKLFHKPVCQLDENGVFLYETTADLDVYAKDGSYLIPAHCVDTEPPELKEGFAAKWSANSQIWEYVPDHRGETVYDTVSGAEIMIDFIGALPDHLTAIARPSVYHDWQNGKWTLNESARQAAQQAEFQAAKSAKISELNQAAQQFVNQAAGTDQLPEFEVQSWTLQAAEAKAWAQNHDTPTPILDNIADARGVPADVLKQAALRKTLAYETLTALVAGQRQALQDKIISAQTLDDLNAVVIAFSLPDMGADA